MTKNNENHVSIDALVKEADRLVSLQISLWEKLLNDKELLLPEGEEAGNEHAFSRGTAKKQIEVLRGEAEKLINREAVIAIVGTMKAGKSTTINAIIGTEALPAHNLPMTTLPTLIRHKPGQSTPVLKFSNRKPLDKLVKKLQAKVNSEKLQSERERDEHINDLVTFVEKGGHFRSEYQDADKITEFLRDLNDLVRMAGKLGVDFPFEDYDEIHEMPAIEVEFAHLDETGKATGGLALLDTPGPNEVGQLHLRRLLKDQLRKATAVLAVLDYTQLNSDADAEIRDELEDIKGIMKGRTYSLVNKFDEKGTDGYDERQVRDLVAKDLMDEVVSEDAVFPASARIAYLANRAMHELRQHHRLPDPSKQPWVEEFGKEAFGRTNWKDEIDDTTKAKTTAEKLWLDSGFSQLLERVIGTAHTNAARLAMESTAAKLVESAGELENHLSIRRDALNRGIAELARQVKMLESDIRKLKKNKQSAEKKKKDLIASLAKSVENCVKEVKEEADKALKTYIETGQTIGIKGRSVKPTPQKGQDFDPKELTIEFKSSKEAEKLIEAIKVSVSKIVDVAERSLQKKIEDRVNGFECKFDILKKDCAEAVFGKVQERLDQAGFKIKFPRIRISHLRQIKFAVDDVFDGLISKESRSKTRKIKQKSWTGGIKRFFGDLFGQEEWGFEKKTTKETMYHIDLSNVDKGLSHIFYKCFADLDKSTMWMVGSAVEGSVDQLFNELQPKIEEIRQNFLQSVRDKKLSSEGKRKLHETLTAYLENVHAVTADCDGLNQDMDSNPLVADEGH